MKQAAISHDEVSDGGVSGKLVKEEHKTKKEDGTDDGIHKH